MPNLNRALRIIAGLVILMFAGLEFFAQTFKVVVTIGPVTFGPIAKIEASGLGRIYFKGPTWYAFLLVLILLMISGVLLLISGVLARPFHQLLKKLG